MLSLVVLPALLLLAPSAVIDAVEYADEAAAQAAWAPMGATAPVGLVRVDGQPALRLRCNFAGTTIERASWDRRVELDLSTCRGITCEVFCRDSSPVSHFSLYFQSGKGWYSTTFHPESTGGWETITIDKAHAGIEGEPAGWAKVSALRLSAWRGESKDTELLVRNVRRNFGAGGDPLVVIVRADSVAAERPAEARSVAQFADTMAERLMAAGLDALVVSDRDLTAELLKPYPVAILPHNPSLPPAAADALRAYLEGGGKLLSCYALPSPLPELVGITPGPFRRAEPAGQFAAIRPRPGELPGAPPLAAQASWNIHEARPEPGRSRIVADWLDAQGQPTGQGAIVESDRALWLTHVLLADGGAAKERLLLAMVGKLCPRLWRQAALAAGRQTGLGSLAEVAKVVGEVPGVVAARARFAEAERLTAAERYQEAFDAAQQARAAVRDAWCRAQQPVAGEFRAFWCHAADGLRGRTWDEAIRCLADNGFNAILPNMLWGGVSFGASETLPVAPGPDQIAACLAACRRYGVRMHVWKVNWNTGWATPKAFLDRMRAEGRLQVSAQGVEEPWLCPSHPANQQLEIDSLVEVARRYPVDGLHFDYIRYPGHNHCFCAGCRERFGQVVGQEPADWPRCVGAGGVHRQAWLDWRRRNIDQVVEGVARRARAARPGIQLSAAVFRNWPVDRDGVGQDWKLWCERGWLDFVCPMDYTTSDSQFANWCVKQREWAGRVPVYPGIGASATGIRMTPEKVIGQIRIAREKGCGGFVVFNYGTAEADEIVPALGLGITRR